MLYNENILCQDEVNEDLRLSQLYCVDRAVSCLCEID